MATNSLNEILVLLGAAVVAVPLFQRLGLGSILGYLAAGVVIGPWGLELITEVAEIRHIAEFGVVFLLFIIGIELKPSRLWRMRRAVFGLGAAQVVLTGALLCGGALLLGLPVASAVILGIGLALSSTAFGVQILNERGEMGTTYGRSGFSILLFQDLAVVPMLALVPLLAAQPNSVSEPIGRAALEALLLVGGVILGGRYLLGPLFKLVAASRSNEAFAAMALLVVLATSAIMGYVGLSMALGAFVAGLLLAESEYRHQVIADIQPFRGFLLGLFFMAVGMSIDFGLLGGRGGTVLTLVVALMGIKALVLWSLCRLFGLHSLNSAAVAVLLCQSGEFAFVLFGLANQSGIMAESVFQMAVLVVALSMALTPLLVRLIPWLLKRQRAQVVGESISEVGDEAAVDHIIIAGFGRVGQRVARILTAGGIPYTAIDMDPDRVAECRKRGFSVFYGDASRDEVLQSAGADRARLLVLTLDNMKAAAQVVSVMRQQYPNLPIHARAHDSRRSRELFNIGATQVVSETLEASLQLGSGALLAAGMDADEVMVLVDRMRLENHGVFLGGAAARAKAASEAAARHR